MKIYLGECSSKVTRPNGERSEILVSNPVIVQFVCCVLNYNYHYDNFNECMYTVYLSIIHLPHNNEYYLQFVLVYMRDKETSRKPPGL